MAVNANNFFSNSIQGVAQIGGDVDLYRVDTVPQFALGHLLKNQDGRCFRYVHFGAITGQGRLVSQDISESTYAVDDMTVVAPASAATTTDGTSGSRFLEVTDASRTQDDIAGAYMIVCAGTGRGYTYRVKANSSTGLPAGPASGNLRIELYDTLKATLTADSDIVVVGHKYANLEEQTGSTDNLPVGVTMANITAADRWGWVQSAGIGGIFQDGNVPQGSIVVASNVDAGAVAQMGEYVTSVLTFAQLPIVGFCCNAVTDTANGIYVPINIQLEA